MKRILLITVIILSFSVGVMAEEQEGSFTYQDNKKRDPLWPLVNSSGVIISYDSDILISDMVLEGIIAGKGDNNLAIINGIIVKPNDKVGQYIVKGITSNEVTLAKGAEEVKLKLKKDE